MEREIYLERAAAKTNFKAEVLAKEVAKELEKRKLKSLIELKLKKKAKKFDLYSQLSYYQKVEEEILAHFISNPALREKIVNEVTAKDFNGRTAQLAEYLFQGKIISNSVKLEKLKIA